MKHYPLLVANWKMYPTVAEGLIVANGVKKALEDIHHVEVVLCPPALMLPLVHEIVSDHKLANLLLGAQNIHYNDEGAFTGEISAAMLKGLAQYVIVGHSERTKWFHETPHETNQKVQAAIKHRLVPIVCVGETRRSSESIKEVVAKLEDHLLKGLSRDEFAKLVIAYEPVWAISSGEPDPDQAASGEYAQKVAAAIREIVGDQTRIVYGGSTTSENLAEFLHQSDIDGALVGAASLKLSEFVRMCEIASELKKIS